MAVHLTPSLVNLWRKLIEWRGEAVYRIGYSYFASITLFGGFGIFALFDIWSTNRRGATTSNRKLPIYRDLILIAVGLVVYGAIIHLHPYLFGVTAIP